MMNQSIFLHQLCIKSCEMHYKPSISRRDLGAQYVEHTTIFRHTELVSQCSRTSHMRNDVLMGPLCIPF